MSRNTTLLCREHEFQLLETILLGILTVLAVFIGCIGNVYSISVVGKFRLGKAPMYYLVSLALWDTTVLICALGNVALTPFLYAFGVEWPHASYLAFFTHGPLMTAMTGSVWTTVAITISRYGAISNPFRSRVTSSSRKTKLICVAILGCAILYCLPCYMEVKLHKCLHNATQTYQMDLYPTALRRHHFYALVYRMLLYLLFVSLMPFLVTLALSIHMIILLRRSTSLEAECSPNLMSSSRNRTTTTQITTRVSKRSRTSRLFVILVCKFLICYFLPTTVMVSEALLGTQIYQNAFVITIAGISNFLVVGHSATNFIVYFWWKQNYVSKRIKKKKVERQNLEMHKQDNSLNVPYNTRESPRFDRSANSSCHLSPSRSPASSISDFVKLS